MIHLVIDDQPVTVVPGRTILEACRENGIHIPTLCYHPALEPYGSCRLCMVEVEDSNGRSRLAASCVSPCAEGTIVRTHTEKVQKSRRMTAELLLAGASNSPEMQALAEELGVKEVRFKLPQANDCVLCGLCVRACSEIVGVSAISVIQRGIAKRVSAPFEVTSSRCIGCGTCVLICPTGAFNLSNVTGFRHVSNPDLAPEHSYYRVGGEVDLRPSFVDDLSGLMTEPNTTKEAK